jgi:hypothetical protein
MKINRPLNLYFVAILIALIAVPHLFTAGTKSKAAAPQTAQLLFVQSAESATFADGKLVLHNVNPLTITFSDRPQRLAGHMPTADWVPFWGEGAKNSFLKDPPNGNLSMLQGRDVSSAVVTLKNPQYADGNLTYDVNILEGTIPATTGACSLFIDIIGCPLTPCSVAGVARRAAWRGGYWGGGYYGPALYNSSGSVNGPDVAGHWGDGSGTLTGWRGNTITWHRD